MRLALAAMLALTGAAAAAQDIVRMGTEGAYPPYSYVNDAGELDGFEIEFGNELCVRADLTCEWVQNEFDSIIPNLMSGNYDTVLAGITITDERDAVIDFTQSYIPPVGSAYVALSPDVDVSTGVVAAQTSTVQASYVAETGATLLEFATQDEAVAAVQNGEADAGLGDYDYLQPIVEASSGELAFVGEQVAIGNGIGMGVRESDAELKASFDAAITTMKEDGSLNALLVKWFGEDAVTY